MITKTQAQVVLACLDPVFIQALAREVPPEKGLALVEALNNPVTPEKQLDYMEAVDELTAAVHVLSDIAAGEYGVLE